MGKQVIVIGGGVIGAACAYFLAKSGWRVTVVDRGQFGMGCSHANCGIICTSHLLPLAEPGAAWKAFQSLFKQNAPIYTKPRFDPALWLWLCKFARRRNPPAMLESDQAWQDSLSPSQKLHA